MPKKISTKQQNPFLQYCKKLSEKTNNYQYVLDYLATHPDLVIKDTESHEVVLNKPVIEQKTSSLDELFIRFLMADKKISELFFKSTDPLTLFNQQHFLELVFNTNEYMSRCHTRYKNKIGLATEHGSVVLNFPFKDCVLVGGMTTAEQGAKIEVFYNEVLDKNSIDKLFQPKLLTKAVKLAIQEKAVVESIPTKIDKQDNLVIKGNNLIALHTLKSQFEEQVDVIYIDPPYYFDETKPSDTFTYNSNFKLSSWLTFMKNRLDVAKQLMSEDGVILISINGVAYAHLKLLCDSIFNYYMGTIVWNKCNAQNDARNIQENHEYILVYTKNEKYCQDKRLHNLIIEDKKVLQNDNGDYYYTISGITTGGAGGTLNNRPSLGYSIYFNETTGDFIGIQDADIEKAKISNNIEEVYTDDLLLISKGYIPIRPPKKGNKLGRWTWSVSKFNKDKGNIKINKTKTGYSIVKTVFVPRDEVFKIEDTAYTKVIKDGNAKSIVEYSSSLGTSDLNALFHEKVFQNAKGISLLKHLIGMTSSENSIVLDFFGGSGTTGHAVLELNKEDGGNRRFIMVEQLDYAQSLTLERVKRAAVKYGYDAHLVYAELKQSTVKQELLDASTIDEIVSVVDRYFDFGYFQNIEDKETLIELINAENNIEVVKKGLIEHIFDHNQEYYSIHDWPEAMLNESEVALNKHFFGLE